MTHELFPPDMRGGGEMLAYEAARALIAQGVELRVMTTGNRELRQHDGIQTERLPIGRYAMNLAAGPIRRAAAGVDVIQTFNYHACLASLAAGRRLGKPVICIVLGFFGDAWLAMKGPVPGRAWRAFERWQLEAQFDATVFISDYSLEQARRLGIRPPNPIVLYPGIEEGKFAPGTAPEKRTGGVLYTGKFERRKGVFEVLEVARALPEVPFRLYGWGPEENALRGAAPPNVTIETYVNNRSTELATLLGRAHICLLPSKAETFGFALVQAMASGCAIVSSIPLEFAGHRVAADDVPAMIAAVRDLRLRKEAASDMGRQNVALSRQYTWDRFARGLIAAYEGALRVRSQS